ncbi:MAG: transporter substrate-binding domain-containing protein [Candidatus Moranbacteria bacterium]|nr:transporter substrate-binding domain-containing protein [Candidatus Moranbacteria bacterium]
MKHNLTIAVADFSPFIMSDGGRYQGFEIDLWERIAEEIGVGCEYRKCDFKEILPLLEAHLADVGLAGITITEEREKHIDFSHETLDSGLLIAVKRDRNKPKFFETIETIVREGGRLLRSAAFGIVIFIVLAGNVLWFAERGVDTFNRQYFPGIFEAFWLTVVSMSTVGFGDYIPETWFGRIVTTGIIFSGAVIFGLLVAQVSAFLAVRKVKGEINTTRDLYGKKVATVAGSTSIDVLRRVNAEIIPVSSANEAYGKLKEGAVEAVVFDAPVAIYYAKNDRDKQIEIVGELFEKQKYGIALREGSEWREPINRAVLKIVESGRYDALYKKWFGENLTMEV